MPRDLSARWTLTATLEMLSAAQIGTQASDHADSTFEHDAWGMPILRGTTLAGALRSALTDRESGYRQPESALVKSLFGSADTYESSIIVYDAFAVDGTAAISVRDGVHILPKTGLDADGAKYDRELTLPHLRFVLRFDLLVPNPHDEPYLLGLLTDALGVLTETHPQSLSLFDPLRLGARRSRGLGACRADDFRACRYDLTTAQGWADYAASNPEHPCSAGASFATPSAAIHNAGGILVAVNQDLRRQMRLEFTLEVESTLLVRSPGPHADSADVVHLSEQDEPILPGESLGGVFRSQSDRILKTLQVPGGERILRDLFGPSPEEVKAGFAPMGSRLYVDDASIIQSKAYRQTRNKIDRFTQSTVDGALFDAEPCVGGQVQFIVLVREPKPEDVGLLLLVARDLVEGLLPVGGEASIGRGIFRGAATAFLPGAAQPIVIQTNRGGVASVTGLAPAEIETRYLLPLQGGRP